MFVPGTGEFGLGAQARDPGLGAALLLLFGRGVFCAGDFKDEARARRVALDGLVDEGLGDGVGLLADHFVDGVAKTGRALAGGSLGLLGGGGFATALLAWFC